MKSPLDSLMCLGSASLALPAPALPAPAHGPHLCVSPSILILTLLSLTLADMTPYHHLYSRGNLILVPSHSQLICSQTVVEYF